MQPVIVRYREYTWSGYLILAICAGAGIWDYHIDSDSAWYIFILLGIFMCLFFAVLGTQKVVFFESGIESKILRWGSIKTWDEVIQAGVTKIAHQYNVGPHLLLTFAGGTLKTRTMGFSDWVKRNGNTCLYVPISDRLRELVVKCYGPLDFE